ncbi:MAG: hypothetical protein NDI93_01085 [Pseudomonas sp.]|nr:hypothetical protein [Pseudomonas sp.]
MSQRINLLLLIVDTVAQVSAKGRWIPYFDVGSRNSRASLYFRPGDFDYSKPDVTWPRLENHCAYLVPDDEHTEEDLVENLEAMLAFARRHLEDRQEAA